MSAINYTAQRTVRVTIDLSYEELSYLTALLQNPQGIKPEEESPREKLPRLRLFQLSCDLLKMVQH